MHLGRIEDRAARFGERKLYRICWQTIFISGKPQWYGKPLFANGDRAANIARARELLADPSRSKPAETSKTAARSRRRWVRDLGRAMPSLSHAPSDTFSSR